MPEPRVWPTIAADDRDKAAEYVNQADIRLESVKSKLPPETRAEVSEAQLRLQKSLRLLEKHGAKTTVPAATF